MPSTELLTCAEMARADQLAIAASGDGFALMARAGAAVADFAAELAGAAPRNIVALCGPGNNGGDAFVAARMLRDRGYVVAIGLLGEFDALKGDAATAASHWGETVAPARQIRLDDADLVIAALFGAGLSRDIDGDARALIERLNAWSRASKRPVLAVDLPSGVDGDTGAVRGVAVQASATQTFFRFKPGHLLLPGRAHCGEQRLADIGISESVLPEIAPKAFANAPDLWLKSLPFPRLDGHKYARGHALAVSGPMWRTGAARLSARGALRAGAGLVTLASPRNAHAINASQLTAIMIAPCDEPGELEDILADSRFNAVVMGPGLGVGADTARLVEAALQESDEPRSIVLDADALTSFAGRADELARLVASGGLDVVCTPHEGEFARLFAHAGSKLERARAAARELGATIVLKGADTVVASPDGRSSIGFDLPPWLATAGSGDVLAGMICGLLAQRMPPFEAASAAVWMHGAAARAFGPGLIAEDLAEQLPAVWRGLASEAESHSP